jgi:5-methylcytosine-specific restriction endonuclease McrA
MRFVICGHCEWEQHGTPSPERCMCQCHPRQARNKRRRTNAGRARVIRALLARDGDRCHWCSIQMRYPWTPTIEHMVPKSLGGSNRLENLVLACDWCNQKRGVMSPKEFRVWLDRNWVPVERRKLRVP